MTSSHAPVHQIELRVAALSALFNSMDPTPFHHRDLDRDAVEFLESWALEFPPNSHLRILVHLDTMPPMDPTAMVSAAMRNYFDNKSELAQRQLRWLLIEGRTSLLIGITFLALCLLGADLLAVFTSHTFWRLLKESLLIGGWVAMWRPLQIFLYDWWPIVRRRRTLRNLGHAKVQVRPTTPPA